MARAGMNPGDRAVWWIENLTLTDDYDGQPFKLRDWQAGRFIRPLFGTIRADGRRQFRKAFWFLPRKQGKTELAAGIGVYCLLGELDGDGCPKRGQEIAVAASDRNQAGKLFKKAVSMIEADRTLSRQVRIYHSVKKIETKKTGNLLEALSSDGRRQHGGNPSVVLFDELHAQRNRELYDALTSGQATRKDRLIILITTAGNNRRSLCHDEYQYACKVRDGTKKDPSYLPVIFEAGPDDDWTDEATWRKAMPAYGDFADPELFHEEFEKALSIPAEESKFRQFYLNQWVASFLKWLNRAKWDECGRWRWDPAHLIGQECYVGLDLSSISDITAMVLVFPWEDGTFRVLCFFWIAEDYALERDRKGETTYADWQSRGLITFTKGGEIDYPQIEEDIPKILAPYKVKMIYGDPHNATSTLQRLESAGLPVERHGQGWKSMSAPIKFTQVLIAKAQLHHGNNPVLNWMADNVVAHRDRHENLTFDKSNSADKIDGIPALVMGISGWINLSHQRKNVYSTRKPEFIGP